MEGKKISRIEYNFGYTNEGSNYEHFIVGQGHVTEIEEHQPKGEGDRWHYDVHFADGTSVRLFNPNQVIFVT